MSVAGSHKVNLLPCLIDDSVDKDFDTYLHHRLKAMSLEKSNLHVDIHKRHKPAFYIQKMSIIFVRWVELSLPCVYLLVFFPKLQKNKKKKQNQHSDNGLRRRIRRPSKWVTDFPSCSLACKPNVMSSWADPRMPRQLEAGDDRIWKTAASWRG